MKKETKEELIKKLEEAKIKLSEYDKKAQEILKKKSK